MVSKASEDFPEPDRPVNTTSLSRGISRSTFLRLCSRAPRIVMARIAEPVCWRLALRTSSMIGIPRRAMRAAFGRASPEYRDLTPIDRCRNVGRTLTDFQCSVQIINGFVAGPIAIGGHRDAAGLR